jgi:hypothetical protein
MRGLRYAIDKWTLSLVCIKVAAGFEETLTIYHGGRRISERVLPFFFDTRPEVGCSQGVRKTLSSKGSAAE